MSSAMKSSLILLPPYVLAAIAAVEVGAWTFQGLETAQRLSAEYAILSLITWYFFWAELLLTSTFPRSEVKWIIGFTWATLAVVAALMFLQRLGSAAGLALGTFGFFFMAYVNLRYGAPVLFDYLLPFPYVMIVFASMESLAFLPGGTASGWPIAIYACLVMTQFWRTFKVGKMAQLTSRIRGCEVDEGHRKQNLN
jgi:hypothetical protein